MHTVEEIRREYDRLDALCGVDTSDFEIVISARSVRRLGSFRPPVSGKRARVMISAALLEDDMAFWDTVRHEYAHAAVWLLHPGERHGHDTVWKAMCRKVGCTPKSTAPVSETDAELRRQRAKYLVRCESCGAETYYLRAGKIVKLMERGCRRRLHCARCGSNELALYEREGSAADI